MSFCGRCLPVLHSRHRRAPTRVARCTSSLYLPELVHSVSTNSKNHLDSSGLQDVGYTSRTVIETRLETGKAGLQHIGSRDNPRGGTEPSSRVPEPDSRPLPNLAPWRFAPDGPMAGRSRHQMNYFVPWYQKLPIDRKKAPKPRKTKQSSTVSGEGDKKSGLKDSDGHTADPVSAILRASWQSVYRLYHADPEDKAKAHNALAAERRDLCACRTLSDYTSLCRAFAIRHTDTRFHRIPRLLAAALTISAESSLRLLEAIHIPKPELHFEILMDALVYIKRHHKNELDSSTHLSEEFERHLRTAFDEWRWPLYRLQTRHLDLFLERFSVEAVDELLARDDNETIPEPKTIFALVDFYTRNHDIDAALDLLRYLPAELLTASEPSLLRRCTNLLKHDTIQDIDTAPNFRILPQILELGIRADAFIHAMIMKNAVGSGVSEVAWDLFDHLHKEKLELPSAMYLILLQDSYRRQHVGRLNKVLTAMQERADLACNPQLVTYTMNMIRMISTFERCHPADDIMSKMFAIYDRAFNRRAMRKLGMFRETNTNASASLLPDPTPEALAYAIRCWVLVQQRSKVVEGAWIALSEHIEAGDETYMQAGKHVTLYDGFVLFFSLSENTIEKALMVVQYMLQHELCEPTERTWANLLYGLQRHGQGEAVTKVCDMMSARGLVPSDKFWERIRRHFPDSELDIYARKHLSRQQGSSTFQDEGQSTEPKYIGLERMLEENHSDI